MKFPILILAAGFTASVASGAEILLNGATSTSQWGFRTFLDATQTGSRAWVLNNTNNPVPAIQTGGVLSSLTPVAVTLAGAPDLTITGSLHAGISGFAWTGDPDQAARDAFSNGSGFFNSAGMTVNIPASIATTGQLYHIEVLAFSSFAFDRRFNVTANGTPFATNWTVIADAPNNYNDVLEFQLAANATGLTFNFAPGTDPGIDATPFVHAIAITPIPEPGSATLLAGAGMLALRRRSRKA
jgi:hypothetical protein